MWSVFHLFNAFLIWILFLVSHEVTFVLLLLDGVFIDTFYVKTGVETGFSKQKTLTKPSFFNFPADLATYITRFQWDMAKYPTKQSLRNIADIISKQTGQIEADLKTKSAAYNSLKGNLQNLEKKQT